jgi:hypothetical protein
MTGALTECSPPIMHTNLPDATRERALSKSDLIISAGGSTDGEASSVWMPSR